MKACRELAEKQGLNNLNMRTVAEKCGVSVGSIYNYFPSKTDLIAATIQDIWRGIFHSDNLCQKANSFEEYVTWIFDSVKKGASEYPNFFVAHSMSFARGERGPARQVMDEYFDHIKAGLLYALHNDSRVKPDAFTDAFTEEDFVEFVFSSLLSLLMKQKDSCLVLIEITKRTIY
ncbi:MAG: TetR/AcrR family transcriptional regulator [Anaerovoracaceae bacterium]